jgi:nucleotide-binding universal stress UspA family protein
MADADALAARAPSPIDVRRAPITQVAPSPTSRTGAAARPMAPLPDAIVHGRHILVCLDRSRPSEVCVPHAVALARTLGSAVTLVHVMQSRREHAGPQAADALGWEISRKEAQGYVERLEREVSAALGRPVAARLEQGRPAERIVDLAHELGADLTVLGSRGEGGGSALTLGSTVQQVLALARLRRSRVAHDPGRGRTEAYPRPARWIAPGRERLTDRRARC